MCCQWNSSPLVSNAVNMDAHTSRYTIQDTALQSFSDLSAHAKAFVPTCICTDALCLLSDVATNQRAHNFAMRRIHQRRLR